MKIALSGVETNNKGAELMLYAILQEIERKYPKAKVFIPYSHLKKEPKFINTSLDFRCTFLSKIVYKAKLIKVFRKLHIPESVIPDTYFVKGADYFIDGSGFAYSDQWNLTQQDIYSWGKRLKRFRKQGTKIVFLPQAFGPLERENTKKIIKIISENSELVMPREKVSCEFLRSSGLVDMSKVKVFGDFTSLVDGIFPRGYENLKNGICIIPNNRMIDKGAISKTDYITLLKAIIDEGMKANHPVFLLNHEGTRDEVLAMECKQQIGNQITVVSGLEALGVKGIIASSYLVVTSRFHGAASALNSCVPCLATSWSHKYKELFSDYGMEDCILSTSNLSAVVEKVKEYILPQKNDEIRKELSSRVPHIKDETREMWNVIWGL